MAHEVVMSQLGLSMDSGQIIQWLKQSGDNVKAGELLLEVESDKSTVEVKSVESGILHIVLEPEDGDIPVGKVIAYLLAEGEQPPVSEKLAVPTATPAPEPAVASPVVMAEKKLESGGNKWPRPNRPPSTPAARRRAKELGIDWRLATPTGSRAAIKERDVIQLAESLKAATSPAATPEVQISPVARRLAELVGLDLDQHVQQYPGKRLERVDVEQIIRRLISTTQTSAGSPLKVIDNSPAQRQSMGRLRSLIAERMTYSTKTYAPVTLTTETDATELVRIREGLKADPKIEVVPSYNALFAKLVAEALLEHPHLNASLEGEEIVFWETVNMGIAVDTERGLVVPVVQNVQARSMHELALEIEELLPRAKEGKALPDELTGGTFTITNLGGYDIDAFVPIINPPESAVLGVGRLIDKWVVVEGKPAIRTMMTMSLTFDHRLVDGGPAALFLQRVKQFVEQPYLWLV